MAIVLQEEKSPINWTMTVGIILTLAVLIGGAYVLFFAPVPQIESILPKSQQVTEELAKVSLDPAVVLGKEEFKRLRQYSGVPVTGQLGRNNPFVK
ncbi:MAG TPA: hypothetical protein VJH70_02315 [Candidatus Paceibacterota bacterium]